MGCASSTPRAEEGEGESRERAEGTEATQVDACVQAHAPAVLDASTLTCSTTEQATTKQDASTSTLSESQMLTRHARSCHSPSRAPFAADASVQSASVMFDRSTNTETPFTPDVSHHAGAAPAARVDRGVLCTLLTGDVDAGTSNVYDRQPYARRQWGDGTVLSHVRSYDQHNEDASVDTTARSSSSNTWEESPTERLWRRRRRRQQPATASDDNAPQPVLLSPSQAFYAQVTDDASEKPRRGEIAAASLSFNTQESRHRGDGSHMGNEQHLTGMQGFEKQLQVMGKEVHARVEAAKQLEGRRQQVHRQEQISGGKGRRGVADQEQNKRLSEMHSSIEERVRRARSVAFSSMS